MKNNISGAIFGCVLLILFGFFGIIGSLFIVNTQKVENATKTTATITKIDISYKRINGKTKKVRDVYVQFDADGRTYNNVKIGTWFRGMKSGDPVKIIYNAENPYEAQHQLFFGKALIIGIIIFLAFVGMAISILAEVTRPQRIEKFKAQSTRLNARVDSITFNKNFAKGKKKIHPHTVECSAYDLSTGSTRQFTRKNIYINLEKYNLKTVPVYISTKNTSKYYIDIDEAIQIAKSNK